MASIEKWVRDYSVNELTVLMAGLIMITHANCGQKEDSGNIDLTIDELVNDLKKYNPNISFSEIKIAFTNGYKGAYGEYFGLNNKTYFGWINAFTWSASRQNAKKLLKPAEVKKELSQEEKDSRVIDGCLSLFEQYKKNGNVVDAGNVNYKFLRRIGVINFTEQRKSEFKKTAESILRKEAQDAKINAKGMFAIRDAIRQLDEINKGGSHLIIAEAKRIALNQYFGELIEMGMELKDQIQK